jgi:plasmid stabilization system protein ParE
MTSERGFNLHPGATRDITEIWEFIADDSVQAARRLRMEIFDAVDSLVFFPH